MNLCSCVVLSLLLFAVGFFGIFLRRNVLLMYLCLELMLNAVNLLFVSFARYTGTLDGPIFLFFTLTVGAAEVAIGLALIVVLFRQKGQNSLA